MEADQETPESAAPAQEDVIASDPDGDAMLGQVTRGPAKERKRLVPERPPPPAPRRTEDAAPAAQASTATDDFGDIERHGIINSAGVDRHSRPVFVFAAANMPPRAEIDQDRLIRSVAQRVFPRGRGHVYIWRGAILVDSVSSLASPHPCLGPL